MEYQLLFILDYDLRFDELEACSYFAPFMSTDAQIATTRALAVDRVTKGGKARSDARRMQMPITPPDEIAAPLYRDSRSTSSLVSAVKDLAKRASIYPNPSPMRSTFSTDSACSGASSEMGSLVDDSGSSCSSSRSGWNSSDSESDTEDHEPRIYSTSSQNSYSSLSQVEVTASHIPKKSFVLRPIPLYAHKRPHLIGDRARMPSDTSSVCTVTAISPTTSVSLSSLHSRRVSNNKRSVSIAANAAGAGHSKDWNLSSSATMPSLPRTGVSGGFLSRMWGAAKGQALGHDKAMANTVDCSRQGQEPNALRRLVLAHSRSGSSRGMPLDV